jgi:hypothetical protein
MRRLLMSLLLFLSVAAAWGGELKVSIVTPTTAPKAAAAPAPNSYAARAPEVGNLDPIELRFTIDDPALTKIVPGGASERPEFELTAFDEQGHPAAVEYAVTGTSVEYNRVTVLVALRIPVDAAERHRQVSAIVDTAISQATGEMKKYLTDNRATTEKVYERLFLQNRTGDFRLHVRLRDPRVAPSEGDVRVHVADRGTFADKAIKGNGEMKRQ